MTDYVKAAEQAAKRAAEQNKPPANVSNAPHAVRTAYNTTYNQTKQGS